MRGILRLIDGLLSGDPEALTILIFAVVATLIIYVIAEVVQRRRKSQKDGR
jgi:membrane protein implicated in regulation of membrane protease activity